VRTGLFDFTSLKRLNYLNIDILEKEKIKFVILHKRFIRDSEVREKIINYLNSQFQIYYQDAIIQVYKVY